MNCLTFSYYLRNITYILDYTGIVLVNRFAVELELGIAHYFALVKDNSTKI